MPIQLGGLISGGFGLEVHAHLDHNELHTTYSRMAAKWMPNELVTLTNKGIEWKTGL